MRYAVLALLGGCNQVFGLPPTRLEPGALPDAPVTCSELGTAPRFANTSKQAIEQRCSWYHFNGTGTLATANCSDQFHVGLRDTAMTPGIGLPSPDELAGFYTQPRPNPDGDRIYFRRDKDAIHEVVSYARTQDGSWSYEVERRMMVANNSFISTVFRGPNGDRMILTSPFMLTELEFVAGGWRQVGAAHPARELRVTSDRPSTFAVTSDGLRAIYWTNFEAVSPEMLYTDRGGPESWFGPPQPLVGAQPGLDSQMTDDCARIYYATGTLGVFYQLHE